MTSDTPVRRVLVVDDEPSIAASIAARLRAEGFRVDVAHDGPGAVDSAAAEPPDLVVLDVMLPGFDGLEVCRRIQADRPVPVLMLTARDDETDMLVGLGVGADDYMTKPFSPRELAARVHALLRRVDRSAQSSSAAPAPVRLGELEIDHAARRVSRAGAPAHLTPTGVRPSGHARRAPERGARPRGAAATGVGLGHRARRAHHPDRGQPREGVAAQARCGPDPDRSRRRLCAGGAPMITLPRPLDPIGSIKVKLCVLLLASGLLGIAYLWNTYRWLPPLSVVLVTVAIVIGSALLLAHGMTRPLREMTEAADLMARGDYSRRVRATSRDEVGALAEAFNRMASDLDAADRARRELVANVSHELRTPIAVLQAELENVVDGVVEPDPATLRTALAQTERLGRLVAELLDLSRVDAGAQALDLDDVPVRDLVDEAVAEAAVGTRVAGRGIGFRVEVEPPDAVARADRARLHQVRGEPAGQRRTARAGPDRGRAARAAHGGGARAST